MGNGVTLICQGGLTARAGCSTSVGHPPLRLGNIMALTLLIPCDMSLFLTFFCAEKVNREIVKLTIVVSGGHI